LSCFSSAKARVATKAGEIQGAPEPEGCHGKHVLESSYNTVQVLFEVFWQRKLSYTLH
jgi:hypothetical protein